jgi:hypothetical protein
MGLAGISGSSINRDGAGAGPAQLSLYRKLAAVLAAVDRIEKDKENTGGGGYKYASEKVIKETFHPLFATHRILLVPAIAELLHVTPPAQGKTSYISTMRYTFELLDLDSGGSLSLQIILSGGDSLDKGPTKALTGAIKYALTTLFLVPTGDDPENDARPRQTPQARPTTARVQNPDLRITDAQITRLHSLKTKAGKKDADLRTIAGAYGYESSKDILVRDYDAICREIEL